ncbi:hypothetical protein F5148DRAFT_1283423 [Russula earlei]|uniref:Uncharacterized protein n=1 Tax=Russula earlei TaxID=71964 RepID=A0ACC0UB68_9AGAM|nr:hypothetical protein F5148DRAFT_1283423 [Russula earlei]
MDQHITLSCCPTTKVQVLIDEEEARKTAKAKKATKKAMNAAKRKQKELQRENIAPTPKPTERSRPPVEEDDSIHFYGSNRPHLSLCNSVIPPPPMAVMVRRSPRRHPEVQVAGQMSRSESAEDPIERDKSDTDQGVYPTERDNSLETYTDQVSRLTVELSSSRVRGKLEDESIDVQDGMGKK